jgi:hypothetical protein
MHSSRAFAIARCGLPSPASRRSMAPFLSPFVHRSCRASCRLSARCRIVIFSWRWLGTRPGEQRGIQPRRFSHRHRLLVLGAAFSRDNSRIVTASADSTARIWDAATGAALATLRGHTGAVAAAAFGPDGSRIVTASADRTARIWQLDPLVLMPADQRQSYICRERLIGARSFTAREMEEPMLRGRDDLRQPCDRLGPFSLYYYRQSAARAGAALRRAFSN